MCSSCTKSPTDTHPEETEDINVLFNMEFPGTYSTATRAGGLLKGDNIECVMVLVFGDKTPAVGNIYGAGKFLYSRFIPSSQITIDIDGNRSFTASLKLSTVPVVLHMITNIEQAEFRHINTSSNELGIISTLSSTIDYTLPTQLSIPMHTSVEFEGISIGTVNETANFLRSVAKVDIRTTDVSTSTFKLKGLSVWFTPDRGLLARQVDLVGTVVILPSVPSSFTEHTSKVELTIDATEIKNQLFIYENANYVGGTFVKKNSRIVVWGDYDNTGVPSYYPVDFKGVDPADATKKIFRPVLRNHSYLINVKSVTGSGYDTEEEAANSAPIDIEADIITWTDENQNIIFDGVNWFSLASKSVILGGVYGNSASLSAESSVDPGKWQMKFGDGDFPTATDEPTVGTYFTATKPTNKEGGFLTFIVLGEITTEVTETLTIQVTSRMKLEIILTALPDGYSIGDWESNPDIDIEIEKTVLK